MKLTVDSERQFWLLAAGIFLALLIVTYFPVFLGRVPFPQDLVLQFPPWYGFERAGDLHHYADIGDLVTSFYPFRYLASGTLREGALPLWNPYILLGSPFLANSQSALFYPLNFVHYIFPLTLAWTIGILMRTFLSAVFTTLFVRSIGGSRTGAIMSGILFSACGFLMAWQGQALSDAAIWLPLICYSVKQMRDRLSAGSIALTSFAFAMPVLAGHPETAAHLTLTGTLLALMLWVSHMEPKLKRFDVRFLFAFGAAGILAVGLSAIQWLPTLEWLQHLGWAFQVSWPTLPQGRILGLISRDLMSSPNSAGIPIPEGAAYFAIVGLLAVAFAPLHPAKRYFVFFALLAFCAFSIAYSLDPIHWLAGHVPVLKGLKNGRLILVGSFGLAILAGLGISVLDERVHLIRKRLATLLLAGTFLVLLGMVYALRHQTTHRIGFLWRPSFSRALLIVGVLLLAIRLYGFLRDRSFGVAVCALAAFDLATCSFGVIGFGSPREVFPSAPLFDFLKSHSDPGRARIIELGGTYASNFTIMYGLTSADGYEVSLQLPRMFASGLTEDRMDGLVFRQDDVLNLKDRRLDLMNVRYIVHSPVAAGYEQFAAQTRFPMVYKTKDIAVFENKSSLPRAFAVAATGIEIIPDQNSQLLRLKDPNFDPEKSVVLAERPDGSNEPSDSTTSPLSINTVEITHSGTNDIDLSADVAVPSILVLSQAYYPGWKSIVDGKEVETLRANLALTGIYLPAGRHQVRFVFDPVSIKIGAALTVSSLLVLSGLIGTGFWRRRR